MGGSPGQFHGAKEQHANCAQTFADDIFHDHGHNLIHYRNWGFKYR